MPDKPVDFTELLKGAPKNWGRWGADDEIGALNFLTNEEVLRGIRAVKQGKTFMLGVPVARPQGDPLHPIRAQPIHTLTHDEGFYISGRSQPFPGGLKYSDDVIVMFPQGTTQYDALGHAWYGDKLYNGYDSKTTIGGLQKCSVQPLGEKGIAGRGILIDAARSEGKFDEPGLKYSAELVRWFHDMEIVQISADNVGCEQGYNEEIGGTGILH